MTNNVVGYTPPPNGSENDDHWHDPIGLGADLGTVLGARCLLLNDHLEIYVDAWEKRNTSSEGHETEALMSNDHRDANSWRVQAARDLLKQDLVKLHDLLRTFKGHASRKAWHGQLIFWTVSSLKLVEGSIGQNSRSSSPASTALAGVLLATMSVTGVYGLFTGITWLVVLWCNKITLSARKKLTTLTLGLGNLGDFKGLKWGYLEEVGHWW